MNIYCDFNIWLSRTFQELATRQHRRDNHLLSCAWKHTFNILYRIMWRKITDMFANVFISSLFSALSKLVSSEISEIKEIWKDIAWVYKNYLFLSPKTLFWNALLSQSPPPNHTKYLSCIFSLKTAEGIKSGQCMARRRSQTGTLPVASPKSCCSASRNSPTGHKVQAFVLTDNPHGRLLLVPSGNQMLPKLTFIHIPQSHIRTSVLQHSQW